MADPQSGIAQSLIWNRQRYWLASQAALLLLYKRLQTLYNSASG